MAGIRAYRGEEPYIFISYAHRDSARVLPLLEAMQQEGYRIWYDEGIAAGTSWPEYIASHLLESSFVLVFLSKASAVSPNCAREIHYAAQYEKPMAAVVLEDVKLSPGLEMQLSICPRINLQDAYDVQRDASVSGALQSLPEAQICRAEEKEGTAAETAQESGAEEIKTARKALLPAAALILMLLAAASFFFFRRGPAEPVFDPQTQVRFFLALANGEESASSDSDIKTIRERLGILMEGRNWNMLEGRHLNMELWLDREAMGGHEPVDVLRHYITRPCRFFVYDEASQMWYPLTADLISSASVAEGVIEGLDAAAYDLPETGYRSVRMEVDDTFAEAVAPAGAYTEPLIVYSDVDAWLGGAFDGLEAAEPAGYLLVRLEDHIWALVDGWQEPNLTEVLCYNLTHEPLSYIYGMTEYPAVEWENGGETVNEAGTVLFSFALGGDMETVSPGQLLDAKAELGRAALALDPAGLHGSGEEERKFYLLLSRDAASSHMLDILCADSYVVSLRAGLSRTDLAPEDITEWDWQDGTLILQTDKSPERKAAAVSGGEAAAPLCLLVNDVPFFLGSVEEDGRLSFSQSCFDAVQDGTVDPRAIAEFLRICLFENRHPLPVSWRAMNGWDEEGDFAREWFEALQYDTEMTRLYGMLREADTGITLLRNTEYLSGTQAVIRLDDAETGAAASQRLRALEDCVRRNRLLEGSFLTGILFTSDRAESGALLQIKKETADGTEGYVDSLWLQETGAEPVTEDL